MGYSGLILHTLYGPRPEKTLPGVLHLMDDPRLGMAGVLEEMLTFPHLNGKTHPTIAMIARAKRIAPTGKRPPCGLPWSAA